MSELHGLLRFEFRRFTALLVKELRLILRDPSYLVIGLGLPLLMLFLYGFGISMDIRNVPADIVLEEHTPAALAVARRFEANAYLSGMRSESPEKQRKDSQNAKRKRSSGSSPDLRSGWKRETRRSASRFTASTAIRLRWFGPMQRAFSARLSLTRGSRAAEG